jgi:hypothetical protein
MICYVKPVLTEDLVVVQKEKFSITCSPSILWNPEFHHRVHMSPPLVPILSQIDPIPTIPSYISKIYFNIVHPSTSWSSPSGLFPYGFPTNILYAFLLSPIRAACPAHLILLDLITLIMLCAKYTLDEKPSIFIRDKPIFSSERMLHKDYNARIQLEKRSPVVGLKGPGAKTN